MILTKVGGYKVLRTLGPLHVGEPGSQVAMQYIHHLKTI